MSFSSDLYNRLKYALGPSSTAAVDELQTNIETIAPGEVTLANTHILVGNAAGIAADVAMSGDTTVDNLGVVTIGAKKVTAAKVALADGKLLIGAVGGAAAEQTPAGDVTITNAGVTAIGAGKVTQAMDVAASRDGTIVKVAAEDAVIGAIPVVFVIAIAAGALAAKDVVTTHKIRVIDAYVVLTGAGVVNTVLVVGNGANAITNTMAVSGADTAVVRAATIDDANWEIAAGGSLRVTTTVGASQPACKVIVTALRVA